jgi:hypothetical protein
MRLAARPALAIALALAALAGTPASGADGTDCGTPPSGSPWSLPAAGCAIPTSAPSGATAPDSMKGWELYSWKDEGNWNFALLPGTNRMKIDAEVRAARKAGWNEIEKSLEALPKGSEVSWNQLKVDGLKLEQPKRKDKLTNRVLRIARKRGLILRGLPGA